MSSQILCPLCRTNLVSEPRTTFADTSVTVPVCGDHGATVSVTIKKSAMADLYPVTYTVRHPEGLVSFR
jgi:hypothetical protein